MKFRDRIKELRRVRAGDIEPNPKNFRRHDVEQIAAMRDLLEEIGFAGAILTYEIGGKLRALDGHMRIDIDEDATVPALVLNVTEAEADLILATFDGITEKAGIDGTKLDDLLESVSARGEGLNALLEDLGKMADDEGDGKLKPVNVQPPPRMTWVLIGIPTIRFGEISAVIEQLATDHEATENFFLETTVNDEVPEASAKEFQENDGPAN